jgi:hypothetical protein
MLSHASLVLGLLLLVSSRFGASANPELTFPVLTIGAQSYTNVTVTTQSKKYVFLLHSAGMTNIKVSELTPEARVLLGYNKVEEEAPKNAAGVATKWAKSHLGSMKLPQVQARGLTDESKARLERVRTMPRSTLSLFAGLALAIWLLHCACLNVLCYKAGSPAGFLIWLPLLNLIPMLRAAKMSLGWLCSLILPVVGPTLMMITWCYKIAIARGKSGLLGLSMLLPGIGGLSFLYLVFAAGDGSDEKPYSRGPQLMTLDAA